MSRQVGNTSISAQRGLGRLFAGIVAALLLVGGTFAAAPKAFAADTDDVPASQQLAQGTEETGAGQGDAPADGGDAQPGDTETPVDEVPGTEPPGDAEAGQDEASVGDGQDQTGEGEDTGEASDTEGDGDTETVAVETATTLTASTAKAELGKPVTFTATVAPAAAGTVQLLNGEKPLGQPVAVVLSADIGVAKFVVSDLPLGGPEIEAVFAPDDSASFASSRSAKVKVIVAGELPVTGATLQWGVKQSFRNYLLGPIACGNVTASGSVIGMSAGKTVPGSWAATPGSACKVAGQPDDLVWKWQGGAGKTTTDGSTSAKANVAFGGGSGLQFRGHDLSKNGVYALDLRFVNPRIVINSATEGTLFLDVKSREFEDTSTVKDKFFEEKDVAFASLRLEDPSSANNVLTWSNVGVTLTADGAKAFGGFYEAGAELDPMTFSLPLDYDGEIIVPTKQATSTTLTTSASKIEKGKQLTLSAAVSPAIPGTIRFASPTAGLDQTVTAPTGKAQLKAALRPGIHSVTATFVPTDSGAYSHSISNAVTVTVTTPNEGGGTGNGNGGTGATGNQAAGSLNWGVSARFTAYTTCVGKENFGMSHCAKGSIATSGVGGGYLFPQATGGNWDAASQTGTVQYSGTVRFTGYGQTMFEVVNPSITVTGPTSATLSTGNTTSYAQASYPLDLSSAQKTVGAGGEVTWQGVQVQGGLMGISAGQEMGFDPLSFTVGGVSQVVFGSTQAGAPEKPKRTPAAAAPATTGITVLTDAKKLKPGGRIELEAAGFDPSDSGVLVVLYSEPVVLDDDAKADANGVVRWTGTLPEDLTGEHTITLQGSKNAGAVIEILDAAEQKRVNETERDSSGLMTAMAGEAQSAGVFLPGAGGMALWEWWASAGGLVVIAACTTTLAVRQRKLHH